MQCPRCQHENREGRRFCSKCGAALAAACPACGFTNEPGDEFCGGCGARLGAPQPSQARFTAPDAYTPKRLAEKILISKGAIEGERKQVTVLFADLKGSMELLADRDPEEARKLLDPVLERMMEAVHRYEGTVNQVMGDGIMALFGAPVAHEDHAVRASYAALDMQAAVRRYGDEVRQAQGISVDIRIGLNSGEVVVRAIGSDLRMDYTAVGQTTHLAARMEQLARPGVTLLTADTLRLAEGFVEVKPIGPVPVRGLETAVEVYELIGAGPLRSRLHSAATRGLTHFVGRDAELEQLRQALGRAGTGHGQLVAIVGEPGVGKSRLVWEITHSHRTHGWLVLQAGSVSYGKATPYLPVRGLLNDYFQIADRDDPRRVREKVVGKVLTLDEKLRALPTPLFGLLNVPVEEGDWQRLAPARRRRQTLEAVSRLLLRESQVQPLLVVFEDLHWIDSETQALLDSLVESISDARLMLLVNYRPEYEHGWGTKTSYTQLRLGPLAPERAEELLDSLVGTDSALHDVRRLLVQRTDGNPFFVEESVRGLIETGVLAGERGRYRPTRRISEIRVPATVQAVLAARIDRLSPEDKNLLQTAAVVGKDVPLALLQAVAGRPEDDLRAAIGRLQAAEFLYEATIFPDVEYTFKHALTYEVAYGSVLHDKRRALHGGVLAGLEHVLGDRVAEHAERLAYHASRGENWDKAALWARQAAKTAWLRAAVPEAAVFCEQAMAAVERLPQNRSTVEQAIDIRIELRQPLQAQGDFGKVLQVLREADRLATEIGDEQRSAWVGALLANHLAINDGDAVAAVALGEQALRVGERTRDSALYVRAAMSLSIAHLHEGDCRAAIAVARAGLATVTQDSEAKLLMTGTAPSIVLRSVLIWALSETGDFDEGGREGRRTVSLAQELGNSIALVHASLGFGRLLLRKGDFSEAVPLLERAIDTCRTAQLPFHLAFLGATLGGAYALAGRGAEGISLLERAIADVGTMGIRGITTLWRVELAEAYLLAGHHAEALEIGSQAVDETRALGQRLYLAWGLRTLGEIVSMGGEEAKAAPHYRDALALGGVLGLGPLVAHCHLGLGKLYGRTGDRAKAEEHLTTAATMYREMDMRLWLEQAEAERRVPG
jgi:predicted ATPase/class 3 adenylate cyclase